MPEPIFRKSTGELVVPNRDEPIDPEPDTLEPGTVDSDDALANIYAPPGGDSDSDDSGETPTAPSIKVEAQPFISDQFTVQEIKAEPQAPEPKSRKSKFLIVVIVILILLAVAVGVTALIVFRYFPQLVGR